MIAPLPTICLSRFRRRPRRKSVKTLTTIDERADKAQIVGTTKRGLPQSNFATTFVTHSAPLGSHKGMKAVIARLDSDADPQDCSIVGCSQPAVFQTVKLRANGSEKQAFLCDDHGQEYAMRGQLVISQNV
jgi:hypothetical protein